MEVAKQSITQNDMLQVVIGAVRKKHPHDVLLGSQTRTLDSYVLSHVDLVEPMPLSIFGFQIQYLTHNTEAPILK